MDFSVTDEIEMEATGISRNTLRRADIVYLIDCTGTMDSSKIGDIPLLSAVKKVLSDLLKFYDDEGFDVKIGLTEFRDQGHISDSAKGRALMKYHEWDGSKLTSNRILFKQSLENLEAVGGGPKKESILDALVTTAEFTNWTEGASRILILFTDTLPHLRDIVVKSKSEAVRRIQNANINQLHLCINQTEHESHFTDFLNIRESGSNNEITQIHDIITRDFTEMTKILKDVHRGSVERLQLRITGSRGTSERLRAARKSTKDRRSKPPKQE
ncbi:VWA domain-containing protein [Euryarchaeota archaeon]|nr:VWA domain-containing protein [Euryarchaeota archaeon]